MAESAQSRRDTLALAGLGVVAVGEGGARALAGPARVAWESRLMGPARWLVTPAVDRLVARGREEQLRLQTLAHGGVNDAVAELLRAGVLEDVADRVGAGLAEPLVGTVLDSPSLDRIIDRLLDSEQLHRVVAHIAASPEVRAALTAQSAGLAEELAGEVRSRSATADDAAERVARRLLRRRA